MSDSARNGIDKTLSLDSPLPTVNSDCKAIYKPKAANEFIVKFETAVYNLESNSSYIHTVNRRNFKPSHY